MATMGYSIGWGLNDWVMFRGYSVGVYSLAHMKLPHLCLGLDLVRVEVVCAYCHFVLGWLGFGFEIGMDTGLWLR